MLLRSKNPRRKVRKVYEVDRKSDWNEASPSLHPSDGLMRYDNTENFVIVLKKKKTSVRYLTRSPPPKMTSRFSVTKHDVVTSRCQKRKPDPHAKRRTVVFLLLDSCIHVLLLCCIYVFVCSCIIDFMYCWIRVPLFYCIALSYNGVA